MEFIVEKYTAEKSILWNDFNDRSKNGLFFYNRDFLEYHANRFLDHSLIIYKKNKVIALFPANEIKEEIISHGGLTFGSLILSFEIKATEVILILKQIKFYYAENKFAKIIYKAIPHIFHAYPSEEDLYALQIEGANIIRRDISSIIKLANKIDINENKRRLNKKCTILNIQISENSSVEDYWNLLTEVLKKYETKPVHSLQEIKFLMNRFPDNIKLYEARSEQRILAGVVIFDFGRVVHTQYLGASDEGRKLGALDFINTFLIEKYKDRKYYSFGISTENQGRTLNEGLIQQKENMGARGIVLDYYEITL